MLALALGCASCFPITMNVWMVGLKTWSVLLSITGSSSESWMSSYRRVIAILPGKGEIKHKKGTCYDVNNTATCWQPQCVFILSGCMCTVFTLP